MTIALIMSVIALLLTSITALINIREFRVLKIRVSMLEYRCSGIHRREE